jgi:hypothetical protein
MIPNCRILRYIIFPPFVNVTIHESNCRVSSEAEIIDWYDWSMLVPDGKRAVSVSIVGHEGLRYGSARRTGKPEYVRYPSEM